MKLITLSEDLTSQDLAFIKYSLSLMETDFLEVVLEGNEATDSGKDGEKIQNLIHKSFKQGKSKFPLLELDDGETYLSEPLSILKFVSKNKYPGFSDHPMIEQWVDILSQRISPLVKNLMDQLTGHLNSEIKQFTQHLIHLKNSLTFIEQHLKLRNYLVGHQMTLADVYLVVLLIEPFQFFFDKKARD
mmetsp:Transcript_16415/g.27809  ORF Transcript_16415/g.27809 Transcript_16415/m.27809 type:complete len:188 (-) Transcript_16415:961-1524(-)